MPAASVDVAVIGAGIIGMSIGYHLLQLDPSLRVAVLERAPVPGTGATAKATGGIRYQFASELQLRLSLLSRPVFENFQELFGVDIGLRHHGYLFVTAQAERLAAMARAAQMQRRLGIPAEELSPDDARRLCPPLAAGDLVGATFCAWDGSADPHAVLQGFWKGFRERGGRLVTEAEVVGLRRHPGSGSGGGWSVQTAAGTFEAASVVLAAGPFSRSVAALAGLELPVMPFRRQVFVLTAPPGFPAVIPLTVDADSGWYVHAHRGGALLCGGTDRDTRPGLEEVVDWSGFGPVCEAMQRRMPVLLEAEVTRAYTGIRALTPDLHPILGPVDGWPGLYLACGMSGHGIMHSPAVGRLVAEWVVLGRPESWPGATMLGLRRFCEGQPSHAHEVTAL